MEPDDELYLVLDIENLKEDILVVKLLVLYDGEVIPYGRCKSNSLGGRIFARQDV